MENKGNGELNGGKGGAIPPFAAAPNDARCLCASVRARVPPYKTTHLNTLKLIAELVPQQFGTNSH